MTKEHFEELNWPVLIQKVKDFTDIGVLRGEDYWASVIKFLTDTSTKKWGMLSYKQANWLQRIIDQIREQDTYINEHIFNANDEHDGVII